MSAGRSSGIDVSKIPKPDVKNLSRTTLAATERFFEDPENVRAFEDWLKNRRYQNAE